jgi:hypothetical protein
VKLNQGLIDELNELLGEENVKVIQKLIEKGGKRD